MKLTIKQRISVAGIYLLLILGIGYFAKGDLYFITNTADRLNSLLIVTALSLVLGTYISEPFFSKPVDVVTRWIAILLFILGLKDREDLIFYKVWLVSSFVFVFVALILIFIYRYNKFEKGQRVAVDIICKISRPDIVFMLLYLSIVISFFDSSTLEYPLLIGFGFLLAINKPVVLFVNWASKLFNYSFSKNHLGDYLGQVIGHENAFLYNVELDNSNAIGQEVLKGRLVFLENIANAIVGIILNEKILLGKRWLQILSLKNKDDNFVSFNIKSLRPLANDKSIFSRSNAVYLLDINNTEGDVRAVVESNTIYRNFENLIGTVCEGSTISKIKFNKLFSDVLLTEKRLGEGSIIQTTIAGKEVLYQIIDARTDEEGLEFKDTHGFTVGTAQKIGNYDLENNELNTVKWLPDIYTPIFLLKQEETEYNPDNFIGKFPHTNYGIAIKNIHELVTHNTAILGILGIGKSCLTFELLQKLVNGTDVKIICIDITNEYFKTDKLPKYIQEDLVRHDEETIFNEINDKFEYIETVDGKQIPENSGNKSDYKKVLKRDLCQFFFESDDIPDDLQMVNAKRIRIFNPDYHKVSEGEKIGYNVISSPLTQAEKTRIIAEEVFKILMKLPIDPDNKAKVLLVFEEAHSLIPEWNSVANEGDKSATNGTAKVILQGRKYGLGSMVITQRTANISKSILNQCNTIFALRVFDDTGKQFLENYIGSEYSNLLPTLEERHCVAIGKAMKLKQPVILELNDMNDIIKKDGELNDNEAKEAE